jgi:trimeric autotransporter adhesin
MGYQAMPNDINGDANTVIGNFAMTNATSASANIAIGLQALQNNATGTDNVALGVNALLSNATGSSIVGIGNAANVSSTNLTNAIVIGTSTTVNASNKVRIGNSSITVIEGQVAYSFPSDGRFKTITNNEVKGLDFITRLRPITYTFDTRKFDNFIMKNLPNNVRNEIIQKTNYEESSTIIHTGFIAQEVEQAAKASNFVFDGINAPKNETDNYSVSYSQFVVPLVKAVQELNAKNEKQQKQFELLLNDLNKQNELLLKRIQLLEQNNNNKN